MGLLGVGFALYTRSDAILLDGFFSFIGFFIALLTIRVARLVHLPDDEKFHFGYAFHEPLMNTVKGLIIVTVCGVALASGIDALLHGGRVLNVGGAMVYAVIATVGCFAIAAGAKRAGTRTGSPLLLVDAKNWMLDGAISSGVALAFLAALLMDGTRWAYLLPYVDPALIVVLVSVMVWVPLQTIWQGVGELLQVAPDPVTQERVREHVNRAVADGKYVRTRVRMVRVGRYLYVLVHLLLEKQSSLGSVDQLDAVRRRVQDEVEALHPKLILDVIFTGDATWVD